MNKIYLISQSSRLSELNNQLEQAEESYYDTYDDGQETSNTSAAKILYKKCKESFNTDLVKFASDFIRQADEQEIRMLLSRDVSDLQPEEVKELNLTRKTQENAVSTNSDQYYMQENFPPDCPWHAYKLLTATEAIEAIFDPVCNYLPKTISVLKNQCIRLCAVKYENTGWSLLYFLVFPDQLHKLYPLSIFAGGAPELNPEPNEDCKKYQWLIPDDLKLMYSVHDGFGEVGDINSCFYFSGDDWSDDNLQRNEYIATLYSWFELDGEEYEADSDVNQEPSDYEIQLYADHSKLALCSEVCDLSTTDAQYQRYSYENSDGNIPAKNYLGVAYMNGNAFGFVRKHEEQTDCPVMFWFHDYAPSAFDKFFPSIDNLFTQYCHESLYENEHIETLKTKAALNDRRAQLDLAQAYLTGMGVKENSELLFYWLAKAAESASAEEQYLLADMYKKGVGTKQNNRQAKYWHEQSANNGYTIAQYKMGKEYWEDDQYEQAIHWFNIAAENNYLNAVKRLGEIYTDSESTYYSIDKAIKNFKKGANAGNKEIQFELAKLYYYDCSIEDNLHQAYEYYKLAASQDHTTAQYYLGWMHEFGEYVEPDKEKAFEWYRKSANNGDEDACYKVGYMYFTGTGISSSYADAEHYFKYAHELYTDSCC